jgi:hypothetical protein
MSAQDKRAADRVTGFRGRRKSASYLSAPRTLLCFTL